MLEVMACETPVLGSRTPPVEEVISEGENGFLFDYFSEDELVEKVDYLMKCPSLLKRVGEEGRKYIVEHYDLKTRCLPQHLELITQLIGG
jgi:Glycosyltransferase